MTISGSGVWCNCNVNLSLEAVNSKTSSFLFKFPFARWKQTRLTLKNSTVNTTRSLSTGFYRQILMFPRFERKTKMWPLRIWTEVWNPDWTAEESSPDHVSFITLCRIYSDCRAATIQRGESYLVTTLHCGFFYCFTRRSVDWRHNSG